MKKINAVQRAVLLRRLLLVEKIWKVLLKQGKFHSGLESDALNLKFDFLPAKGRLLKKDKEDLSLLEKALLNGYKTAIYGNLQKPEVTTYILTVVCRDILGKFMDVLPSITEDSNYLHTIDTVRRVLDNLALFLHTAQPSIVDIEEAAFEIVTAVHAAEAECDGGRMIWTNGNFSYAKVVKR